MKRIRNISPVISLFLIMLMLAGSFGFTLIHHTCFHCGTDDTVAALAVKADVTNFCHAGAGEQNCHMEADARPGEQNCHMEADARPGEQNCHMEADARPGEQNCRMEADAGHCHSTGKMIVSDDCCTHKTERIVTDEPVRAEVQKEIIPYFIAATLVAVIGDQTGRDLHSFAADKPLHRVRDLTTIHCRLQS